MNLGLTIYLFLDSSCIQQIRQNEQTIALPPNTVEISATVLTYFTKSFLSIFFPESESLLIEAIADNISTTIIGLYVSLDGCMRCENLLDQWEKEFFIIHTDKIKSYYNQTYPDMETLDPLHLEVCLNSCILNICTFDISTLDVRFDKISLCKKPVR